MSFKFIQIAFIAAVVGLTGCSKEPPKHQLIGHSRETLLATADYNIHTPINAENSLAMAAESASASLAKIASYDLALHPKVLAADHIDPKKAGLEKLQSINWIGSAEKLLAQIAPSVGYTLKTVGKPPMRVPTVTIDVKATTALDVLRKIKYQLHQNNVELLIDTKQHVVELQYRSV